MMKHLLITGALGVGLAMSAAAVNENATTYRRDTTGADDPKDERRDNTGHNWRQYKANDLSVGLFGTGTVGEKSLHSTREIERDGRLGAGVGVSYFFTRYVGLESYAYTESTGHNFVDNVAGNLIARLPLGHSGVAPYAFGGGGRQFDPVTQWTWDAGAGIEWRFCAHVGIFADARFVWADKTEDYGLGRVGLKFGF